MLRFLLQQSRRLHDLTALAIAALRNLDLLPRPLHRMSAVFAQTFNSRDLLTSGGAHRCQAASSRFAVHMYGASTAYAHAAAEFRSSELQFIAQVPKQRHVRIAVKTHRLAVDRELNHLIPFDN